MRRVVHIGIMIALSVVLVVAMVSFVGFGPTLQAIGAAGVAPFAAVGVLTALGLLIQAGAWAILNRPIRHNVRFRSLFAASTVGLAGNLLTPSSFLGGEPFRVLYVSRTANLPYHEVASAVVLVKYLEATSFVVLFSFSAIVSAIYYQEALFGPYLGFGVAILAVAGILLGVAGAMLLSLWRGWRPLSWIVRAVGRLPRLGRRIGGFRRRTRQMEDQVSRVFREEGRATWPVMGGQLLGQLAIFLKPAAFFYLGSHLKLDLGQLCLLYVACQFLLSVQIMPAGAGTLDTGLLGTFALMGLGESQHLAGCMAYLLCLRLWDVVLVGAGAWLTARLGVRMFTARPEPLVPSEPPEG